MIRTLRASVAVAAAALALAGAAAPALAKAPAKVPTLEDIRRAAQEAEAEAARLAAEAQRDPNREAIEGYRTKKTKLEEWQKLVEIVKDAKTPELQPYRELAADALLQRFAQEDVDNDANVRHTRVAIAIELADLLKADKKDVIGLTVAGRIFYAWYRGEVVRSGWKAEDSTSNRTKAQKKILAFLKRSERD